MKRKNRLSRREFLAGSATALAITVVPASVFAVPPSGKLNFGCIGVGGMGGGDVNEVSNGNNIVALCDVDARRAEGSFKRFPDAKKYKDFRIMLDKEDKNIDAVTVSTPDHVHAPASMMAIKRGKHVFCQKPLTHSIYEARMIAEAAKKYKVATQMGIQGHANEGVRLLREWIEAGAIGDVTEIHYWTDRPIWPQGIGRPKETKPIPAHLDWDLWLGPAPYRPYHDAYLPFRWRGWWDFGCGALGDIACHSMDAAFWTLKLGSPISVKAECTPVNDETAPLRSVITYQFPKRGKMPPVKVVWFDGSKDGKNRPPRPKDLEEGRNLRGGIGGQLFYGTKGTIMSDCYGSSPRIIPETKMREFLATKPEKKYPRSIGHKKEWFEACKGGKPAGANFPDHAGPLTEMVLLGNLAVRSGEEVTWDAKRMRTNSRKADSFIRREYRKGWVL